MSEVLNLKGIDIWKVQVLAITGSIFFLFFILYQIQRKKIKEEYSILWLSLGVVFIVISVWRDGLDEISRLIGVAYPPAALFLILIMAVFVILIQFSIIISKLADNNRQLAQEHSLLKLEFEKLRARYECTDYNSLEEEH